MTDGDRGERYGRDHAEWRDRLEKLWNWLKSRPAESWLFLVIGLAIGKFLL